MDASVIIPTRDHYITLGKCLSSVKEALSNTSLNIEVIILDGGRESSLDVLQDSQINNSCISQVEPWWAYSKIVNEGVKIAKGETILLLHDDCKVPKGVFNFTSCLGEKEIVGGLTYSPDGFVEQSGLRPSYNDPSYKPIGFGLRLEEGKFSSRKPVPAVPMVCSFIKKEFFNSLGGFDENYRWCMEDVDICLRAWEAGGSVSVQQDLQAEHIGSNTLVHRLPSDSVQNNLMKFGQRWLLNGRIESVAAKVKANGG